jgi:urease beta subunit
MAHVEALSAIPSRHVNSPGTVQAAEYIHTAFGMRAAYQTFPAVYNDIYTDQRNVIATLPGTDPTAGAVVLVAHYDSRTTDATDAQGRAPGANDNASGVAALIEIATLLEGVPHRRPIVLIAAAGEEVGLLGSRYAAEQFRSTGTPVTAVIAVDTIGNARGAVGEGVIRVFSPGPPGSPSRWYAYHSLLTAEAHTPALTVAVQNAQDRPGRYGDHFAFIDAGYPAIRYIEREEDLGNNHSAGDTPDRLSPGYLQSATRLMLAQALSLATSAPTPQGLTLEGDVLSWQPVAGSSGYLVVIRQGDEIIYQEVTTQTQIPLPAEREGDAISVASLRENGALSPFAAELSR